MQFYTAIEEQKRRFLNFPILLNNQILAFFISVLPLKVTNSKICYIGLITGLS